MMTSAARFSSTSRQKCGGLLEGRKIADMAHTYYVPFAPHCVVSPIGTMASCHVCAAVPNFLVLEWHWIQRLELWRNFVQEGDIIEKGFVPVPDRPGFGVEMNEDARAGRRCPGHPGSSRRPECPGTVQPTCIPEDQS